MTQWGKRLLSKPASTGKRDNPGKLSSDPFIGAVIGVHLHSHIIYAHNHHNNSNKIRVTKKAEWENGGEPVSTGYAPGED